MKTQQRVKFNYKTKTFTVKLPPKDGHAVCLVVFPPGTRSLHKDGTWLEAGCSLFDGSLPPEELLKILHRSLVPALKDAQKNLETGKTSGMVKNPCKRLSATPSVKSRS